MEHASAGASRALARLVDGAPALLVVAHPDDETIGIGGHLASLPNVVVLHLTSGAPRDPSFARSAGFDTPGAYAAARARELARALDLAGVAPTRRRSLGLHDQEASEHLVEIGRAVRSLAGAIGARVVLTHAYEGGHPDHDAAAFACAAAARCMERPPAILEMPYYHRAGGGVVFGRFLPRDGASEHVVSLSRARLDRKRAMLACFASQASVLASMDPSTERFRLAPLHDFARPPHAGSLHYEALGWRVTGASFRARAAEASRLFAREHACAGR